MLNRSAWLWVPGLLALLAFARSLPGAFLVIDDDWLVAENPVIQDPSAANVMRILDPFSPREVLGHEYLPLRDLSYMADVLLSRHLPGAPSLPAVCHATQILLHALCAVGVARLGERLTRGRLAGFLAGALFALHPVHAEAVCWVSSRKDLLGTAFALGSALAWRRHWTAAGRGQLLAYAAAWAGYVAAMLCKAPMSVLPGLLMALDLFFPPSGARWGWRHAARLAPFLAVFLPFRTLHVTHAMHGLISTALPGIGRFETALTMARVGVRYLGLLAAPLRGQASYLVSWSEGWGVREAACAGILAAAVIAAGVLAWRARRGGLGVAWASAGLGLCWLGIGMLPASNLFYRSLVLMADRYLYLPSVGLCLGAAGLLSGALPRLGAPLAVLAAAFLARDWEVSGRWLGTVPAARTILREGGAAQDFPNRMLARAAALAGDWPEALARYRRADRAVAIPHQNPWAEADSAGDLAAVLSETGRPAEALSLLDATLARFPAHPRLLALRGRARALAGDRDGAASDLEARARAVPWQAAAWLDLGILRNNQHRFAEARDAFERALALDPGSAEALHDLGIARQNLGDLDGAAEALRGAVARGFPARHALANLQMARAQAWLEARRRLAERRRLQRQLEADPLQEDLRRALAALAMGPERERLAALPAEGEAARLEEAQALAGSLADAEYLLGAVAAEAGKEAESERRYRRALALRDEPLFRRALGELLRERGVRAMLCRDLEGAWAAYREALGLFPAQADTTGLRRHLEMVSGELVRERFERAAAAFSAGDLEAARRGFRGAVEIEPAFFEAWFNLGLVAERLGDRGAAAEAFGKALALKPDDAQAGRKAREAAIPLPARR